MLAHPEYTEIITAFDSYIIISDTVHCSTFTHHFKLQRTLTLLIVPLTYDLLQGVNPKLIIVVPSSGVLKNAY